MTRTAAALVALLVLAGCGASPLGLLTGGGPNVAANVQAGAENHQTIGQSEVAEQRIMRPVARSIEQSAGETRVRAEAVQTVVVNEVDWRYVAVIALLAGFLIPSPVEIARWLRERLTGRRLS